MVCNSPDSVWGDSCIDSLCLYISLLTFSDSDFIQQHIIPPKVLELIPINYISPPPPLEVLCCWFLLQTSSK
ncbi:hypothetical protein BDR06DRAFT_1009458 [Suillus hirtellus]|nr:hypothetical protein BDR06DRAFT_1009458 [Suillus hirtellus]